MLNRLEFQGFRLNLTRERIISSRKIKNRPANRQAQLQKAQALIFNRQAYVFFSTAHISPFEKLKYFIPKKYPPKVLCVPLQCADLGLLF